MSIEEKILNDNSCSPYVDKERGYVGIAFKDGAYWGYEEGRKTMIEKACEYLKNALYEVASGVTNSFDIMSIENTTMDDFISSFRKAMEE